MEQLNLELVEELKKFPKLNINIKDNRENTPVSMAIKAEREDIIEIIKRVHTDKINDQNVINETLLT